MIRVSPSILSSDYSKLGEEIKRMEDCGADMLHIDVMDGHFVPNITIGAPVVKCIRKCSKIPLDVHLMISNPLKYVPDYAEAGSDIITFHVEADDDAGKTIDAIKSYGVRAAVSVNRKTPAQAVFPYLDRLDMVLVMTVEPGFGGQSFMAGMLPKISLIKKEIDRRGLNVDIQVDGGINCANISEAAKAGANIFVAGSSIFGADDAKAAIEQMRAACSEISG